MKLILTLCLIGSVSALAATEEQIQKRFSVQTGGSLSVDVDFGTIDVTTNAGNEAVVDVWRKVSRKSKAAEEAFLKDHPVTFSVDASKVAVRSRGKNQSGSFSSGRGNRLEAKYTISVPAQFNARLETAGGSIAVAGISGEVKAHTSGGGLRFAELHGPLDGDTSGGSINVRHCEGSLKIHTSGGGIEVDGGSGSLNGDTSGGSISVKHFHGPTKVDTSGGGLDFENVAGQIEGETSGGSIRAVESGKLEDSIRLSTSGGGVMVRLPADAGFDLDAATSGGSVSSELPVTVTGKMESGRLKGSVNGGGKTVFLRSSGGSIHILRAKGVELESSAR